jgi:uncharacterized coiled-coil protein SlyX
VTTAIDERERIRAAMERILADAPQRSTGALTITALAQEADVPRNALTQRHLDLKNEFYRKVADRGAIPDVEVRLRAEITKLKKTIANQRHDLDRLRLDVPALVRVVNALTAENQELRSLLEMPPDNVVPLRDRRNTEPT